MPNNKLERDHGTIEYAAGETVELSLPRSHYYERLNLLCDYDVTVATDAKAGMGILDLIDRIEVEFDGSKTVKSTDFATSHLIDRYQYGTAPVLDQLDHTSATQQTGQMQTFVDFLLEAGKYGGLLPSFAFSDLSLKVKWATASAVGDVTVNDASIAVESKERRKDSVANPPKVTTGDVVKNLITFKERQRTVPLSVTGEERIDLPPGNAYHSVGMLVLDNDAASNSLIENVEVVENGVNTHVSTTFDLLRTHDKQEYGIESLPDGFAMVNYGVRGNTDDVISTKGMDSFELILDTDGTAPTDPAEARVVTREIIS